MWGQVLTKGVRPRGKGREMSKRSTDTLVRETEVPQGALKAGAAGPRLSGRVIGLAAAALLLAFGFGFAVVWNQDTEQPAPRVIQDEDPRLKYEFEGGAPVVAPRVVIQDEDPRLKYEFEGGAPVTEPRPYESTSGNPLE